MVKQVAGYCVVFAAVLLLPGCGLTDHGFLASAGPVAQAERDHFFSIIGWTLIVIVPLFVAAPIVLWKYRIGKKGAVYRPNWDFSWILEGLIWGLPVVVVAVLGWNLWQVSHKLDPYKPIAHDRPALDVQVVSLDWKWLFIYPDQHMAAVNELVLPVDRPIHFSLTSATVMQSFMIPRLGSQIYTMPGMVTQLHLLAAKPGRYGGLNTQYNGEGFAEQKFSVQAVSAARFHEWVADQRSRPALDMAEYRKLSERSILPEPKTFGRAPSKLFERIVSDAKRIPAASTAVAAPKSDHEKQREKERLKQQRRDYREQQS
ncbi:cytochrome ubiquinol oxidase subunit II [Salinisphaera sp. T31B1]|uniref:cytochrome ubiquinol oxidase subunit II n=1 Tax=Salinisphaera sp. T31B1 TaxID=727963 RepID=UPI0033422BF4